MRRISIKSMMNYLAFIAVGLAALRNANELWAGVMIMLTLGTLGAAIIGIVCRHGIDRVSWFGFVLFGIGYMAVAFGSWFSAIESTLVTTKILRYAHDRAAVALEAPEIVPLMEKAYLEVAESLKDPASLPPNTSVPRLKALVHIIREQLIDQDSKLTEGVPLSPSRQAGKLIRRLLPGARDYVNFARIGHCLFALLAGLIGAFISSRMYREQPAATQPDPVTG